MPTLTRGARFSRDRRFRYTLTRTWDLSKPTILFIGLNPSTADEYIDDPTIRRCMRFARDWGFGKMFMGNIFAYRSTLPKVLHTLPDPVGARNNWWLKRLHREAKVTVAAWGNHGELNNRHHEVLALLGAVHCLGQTGAGYPRHPLYLRATTRLSQLVV